MMWEKSLLVFLFSLSTLKAELDCEMMKKTTEFISPTLDSKTNVVMKGQNISLICSNQNKPRHITYVLFRGEKHIRTQTSTGEPMIFNLSISEAEDLGPYKCKAQLVKNSSCSKYSHPFNFTLVDPVTTPVLNITVVERQTNHYLILRCISFHGSLPINYTFFEKGIVVSPVISKNAREPAEFTLSKKNTGERQEYRCEAKNRLPDHAQYSHPVTMPSAGGHSCPLCLQLLLPVLLLVLSVTLILAFWILPKYKARKAMRDQAPRDYGNTSTEVGIYANVHTKQAGEASVPGVEPRPCASPARDETKHSQEIHYSTPVFRKVTPGHREAYNDGKVGCVYSDLNL